MRVWAIRRRPVQGRGGNQRLACVILAAATLAGRGAYRGETAEIPAPLSRTNLLCYQKSSGQVAQVDSTETWLRRRKEIIRAMQSIMGPLPADSRRCALNLEVAEEVDCGQYLRRSILYSSEPNSRVPAYLLVPKAALRSGGSARAILALHPTDMQFGRRVVVEELRGNYRAYARDLVELGFVVLSPAYPIMADYQPDLKALGYQSGTMKAIWDNLRGIDLLESFPFVRKGGVGAIGHSLGGHNAIYTSVFDPRVKAVVSSCGFDSYSDYMNGNITGWTSERYMPKLLEYKNRLNDIPFDFYELLGALAPRPVFVNAPTGDSNFNWRSVDKIIAAARPVYALFGSAENLRVVHPDCAHDFPPEIRRAAYEFLKTALEK